MKYVNFHEADIPKKSRATLHDAVIEDILSFFKYQTYNQNIINVLVHATADALNLCLHMYQKYDNNIQIVHIDRDDCIRNVYLNFHRNPLNLGENHYDAIVLDPSKAVKELKKKPKTTIHEPIIIESSLENSPQHITKTNTDTAIIITPTEEQILIPDSPDIKEPQLKKPKIENDDIKTEDEIDNIPQFPNINVDYFFTRAFNSYGLIKTEEFQVE